MTTARQIPFALRMVRASLRKLNAWLNQRYRLEAGRLNSVPLPDGTEVAAAREALIRLDVEGPGAAYFAKHLPRLARTLSLVPPSSGAGSILELGCYMQLTPFLKDFRGYASVRGAHYGPAGRSESKVASIAGKRHEIPVDLFDAERDQFPYRDNSFETVLVCELIEHLTYDPMHMLLEIRRVLTEGGRMLLTTPNIASLTSVARVLHGYDNPQIYAHYSTPAPGPPNIPHVREYTAFELQEAVQSAGFEIEDVITEPIEELAMNLPLWNFLDESGYNTSLRGEQTYCLAIKRAGLPVTRYPKFLYAD